VGLAPKMDSRIEESEAGFSGLYSRELDGISRDPSVPRYSDCIEGASMKVTPSHLDVDFMINSRARCRARFSNTLSRRGTPETRNHRVSPRRRI